jgi:hypothetical protein
MFFQNLFDQEFRGTLFADDRQYTLNFNVKANSNRSDAMVAWNKEPYDMSSLNTLTVNYAIDFASPNFASLSVNVAGTTPSATRAYEVVNALNADAVFAALFQATLTKISGGDTVLIRSIRPKTTIRSYISNTGAERVLRFNLKAPVGELPSYFDRHTIANTANYPDLGTGLLIRLDTGVVADQEVITYGGFDHTAPKADWQLLVGRGGSAYIFEKNTYDGSGRLTAVVRYPAGARVGDLAKRTTYTYTGPNTYPNQSAEVPYILTSGDLITP